MLEPTCRRIRLPAWTRGRVAPGPDVVIEQMRTNRDVAGVLAVIQTAIEDCWLLDTATEHCVHV